MDEIIAIVNEEIEKVIDTAVIDLNREVCQADFICARVNIARRLKEL